MFLAREILREQPELGRFSGHSQEALQDKFREYDNRLKGLHCKKIAWKIDQASVPAGISTGAVSNFSELCLLRRVCGQQRPRTSIRQLVKRAGNALVALKPCFYDGAIVGSAISRTRSN